MDPPLTRSLACQKLLLNMATAVSLVSQSSYQQVSKVNGSKRFEREGDMKYQVNIHNFLLCPSSYVDYCQECHLLTARQSKT
jgi:hypothetical protein